jgi:outer membrane biosynthesis protein TonB
MKKLILPVMFLAILAGLYEQSKDRPNIYIEIVALVLFMYGMMQLSAKTPSKNVESENEDEDAK